MADSDAGPDDRRAPTDQDLFVFTEADIAELTAEFHAFLREVPEFDESTTEEASRMMYQLLTGDFSNSDPDDE